MARGSSMALVWLLAAGVLPAQFPGEYPGRYPAPAPFPRIPFPGRGKKAPPDKKPGKDEVLPQYTGKIDKVEPDTLSVVAPDTRVLVFKCTKNTRYLREGKEMARATLKAGDEVMIEARTDDQGFFYAINVNLQKPAPSSAPAAEDDKAPPAAHAPSTTIEAPVVVDDPDDPGPPILRRGKPVPRPSRDETESAASEPAPPPPAPNPDDVFLEKARDAAMNFSEVLPNYICQQFTTRYQGEGRPVQWSALDVVSANVIYEDGKEHYRDIKINGKAVNKPMEQIPGSWSRGEFGTTLRDLFSPATAAEMHQRGDSTASGRSAVIYDFSVEQPRSHWQTMLGGQSVTPAYKGSVWIDKQTQRVLRIEMQARDIPDAFPLNIIEWVVDYSYVRIGTTHEYLLPVRAENLSCWRGGTQCVHNALDFRNYRKFTSESQIMTTDSTITFEGGGDPKPPKKK